MTPFESFAHGLESILPLSAEMRRQVFAYCERGQDIAFWAEPLNAISNVAFHIAALMALWLWAGRPRTEARVIDLALIAVVFVIGTGSFLFHTLATRWASIADVAPIGIFMIAYLAYALKRWTPLGWIGTAAGLALFFTALTGAGELRCGGGPCLNGSVGYLPAFAALILIGAYLVVRGHPAGKYLAAAGLVFAVSLTFRSVDRAVCPYTILVASRPWGTHFLWHLLNATLLYLLLRAAVLHGGTGPAAASPATPASGAWPRRDLA